MGSYDTFTQAARVLHILQSIRQSRHGTNSREQRLSEMISELEPRYYEWNSRISSEAAVFADLVETLEEERIATQTQTSQHINFLYTRLGEACVASSNFMSIDLRSGALASGENQATYTAGIAQSGESIPMLVMCLSLTKMSLNFI